MVRDVGISEVGPRDGLQMLKGIMPTEKKKAWISALAASGLPEIEVSSFVPPKLLPQMADAAEIVAFALTLPGLHVAALAPNAKGAARAIEAGAHKITLPLSVSRSHSLANVRKTPDEMVDEVRQSTRLRDASPSRPAIEVGLSTAFGCTIEGTVAESEVVRLAIAAVEAGADEVGLADTTGMANPEQIKRVIAGVRREIGDRLTGVHLHNTFGLGLANALAAYEAGLRAFDSSQAGLGGCPYAPGASGNIVTEDLVYMFESMGVRTGIDLWKLMAGRRILADAFPDEPLYGYVPAAGLPKNFRPAA
ncbi:MAG: hydroxymethylglutaryl-CoA lyase [Alphaproteobacteria bacterium]|nr:hydroxymethylglutaryl-CoA lyase [Alphaproteobacteria bacterium]